MFDHYWIPETGTLHFMSSVLTTPEKFQEIYFPLNQTKTSWTALMTEQSKVSINSKQDALHVLQQIVQSTLYDMLLMKNAIYKILQKKPHPKNITMKKYN